MKGNSDSSSAKKDLSLISLKIKKLGDYQGINKKQSGFKVCHFSISDSKPESTSKQKKEKILTQTVVKGKLIQSILLYMLKLISFPAKRNHCCCKSANFEYAKISLVPNNL